MLCCRLQSLNIVALFFYDTQSSELAILFTSDFTFSF